MINDIRDRVSTLEKSVQDLRIEAATKLSVTSTDHMTLVQRTDRTEQIVNGLDNRLTKLEVKMNLIGYISGATFITMLGLLAGVITHLI